MKKYLVTWTEVVHVGKEVVVEANSPEEAERKKYENNFNMSFILELDTNVEEY